jgi:hypothetical protein
MSNAVRTNQLLRFAFITGPLLMVAASAVCVAGIGTANPASANYVEGIIGCYGIVLFIPIYWELSRRLSFVKNRLATFTYITGLLGPATGFTHMYTRIFEYELRLHGAGDAVWQSFYTNPGGELLSVALLGPLFPLTSILLGIGFLITRQLQRWLAACLVFAGILFPAAMISESPVLMRTAYPAACGLWLLVFSYYAIRYMRPQPVVNR